MGTNYIGCGVMTMLFFHGEKRKSHREGDGKEAAAGIMIADKRTGLLNEVFNQNGEHTHTWFEYAFLGRYTTGKGQSSW